MQTSTGGVEVLNTTPILRIGFVGAILCMCACAQELPREAATSNPKLASIVEQMEKAQLEAKPTASYQVFRQYRLFGARSSSPTSEVLAEVDYLPPNRKSYVIQKRMGSSRGEDVVRRILQHESQMVAAGKSWSGAAINRENYSFSYLGKATLDGNPCYLLGLDPKRKESELISGKAWVDERSFLVHHIEGQMAKNPSWWLKKVDLKIDFADFGGAWLQTGMEAVADVRFLGSQALKSQTVDAHVGDVLGQTTSLASHNRIRKSNRGMPATVIVPLDRQQ
jgi:hypothetical protein